MVHKHWAGHGSSIRVSTVFDDESDGLSVHDFGPGMRAEENDRVFNSFEKLSSVLNAGEKTTGLGLAIAKRIIDDHRGSILGGERLW